MVSIGGRIKSLLNGSGLVLFLIRLPFRVLKTMADRITTLAYGFSLGSLGKGSRIEYGAHIENPKNVYVGSRVYIGKGTLIVSEYPSRELLIEDGVQINRGCHIDHTGKLKIGRDTLLSEGVHVFCHSHGVDPRSAAMPLDKTIGENCWIGARAMIMERAALVADGALVGAGSVVTKSLTAENNVYVGAPAKCVGTRW